MNTSLYINIHRHIHFHSLMTSLPNNNHNNPLNNGNHIPLTKINFFGNSRALFNQLPAELHLQIATYLSAADIHSCSHVSAALCESYRPLFYRNCHFFVQNSPQSLLSSNHLSQPPDSLPSITSSSTTSYIKPATTNVPDTFVAAASVGHKSLQKSNLLAYASLPFSVFLNPERYSSWFIRSSISHIILTIPINDSIQLDAIPSIITSPPPGSSHTLLISHFSEFPSLAYVSISYLYNTPKGSPSVYYHIDYTTSNSRYMSSSFIKSTPTLSTFLNLAHGENSPTPLVTIPIEICDSFTTLEILGSDINQLGLIPFNTPLNSFFFTHLTTLTLAPSSHWSPVFRSRLFILGFDIVALSPALKFLYLKYVGISEVDSVYPLCNTNLEILRNLKVFGLSIVVNDSLPFMLHHTPQTFQFFYITHFSLDIGGSMLNGFIDPSASENENLRHDDTNTRNNTLNSHSTTTTTAATTTTNSNYHDTGYNSNQYYVFSTTLTPISDYIQQFRFPKLTSLSIKSEYVIPASFYNLLFIHDIPLDQPNQLFPTNLTELNINVKIPDSGWNQNTSMIKISYYFNKLDLKNLKILTLDSGFAFLNHIDNNFHYHKLIHSIYNLISNNAGIMKKIVNLSRDTDCIDMMTQGHLYTPGDLPILFSILDEETQTKGQPRKYDDDAQPVIDEIMPLIENSGIIDLLDYSYLFSRSSSFSESTPYDDTLLAIASLLTRGTIDSFSKNIFPIFAASSKTPINNSNDKIDYQAERKSIYEQDLTRNYYFDRAGLTSLEYYRVPSHPLFKFPGLPFSFMGKLLMTYSFTEDFLQKIISIPSLEQLNLTNSYHLSTSPRFLYFLDSVFSLDSKSLLKTVTFSELIPKCEILHGIETKPETEPKTEIETLQNQQKIHTYEKYMRTENVEFITPLKISSSACISVDTYNILDVDAYRNNYEMSFK